MIYIKKLIINNFQSHKHSEFEFVNGLNAIVGQSNSGKTAVFRALKWVIYNEPLGDYFVREGESETSVSITLNTDFSIKRYRTKSKNGYEVTSPDGEVAVYEGFGSNVPEEITNITKMIKIDFTSNESRSLNLAEQLESAFLISEKPSVRASAIGRLVGVEVLDEALRMTSTDLRRENQGLKLKEEAKVEIEQQLSSFKYLDDLEDKLIKSKAIIEKIELLSQNLQVIDRLKVEYSKNITEYNKIVKVLELLKDFNEINYLLESIEKNNLLLNSLISNNERLKQINRQIDVLNTYTEKLQDINSSENQMNSIVENMSKYNSLMRLQEIMIKNDKSISAMNSYLNVLKGLESSDELHSDILKKLEIYNHLKDYSKKIDELNKRISDGNKFINMFRSIDYTSNLSNSIVENQSRLDVLNKLSVQLKTIDKQIYDMKVIRTKEDKTLNGLVVEYKKNLVHLKECPTCHSKLSLKAIENIVRELN
ncbi:MAG: AAA family ATPase [Tissierellia bacterium]|nr:AAA family ATPase [Tissierellia bacterium]